MNAKAHRDLFQIRSSANPSVLLNWYTYLPPRNKGGYQPKRSHPGRCALGYPDVHSIRVSRPRPADFVHDIGCIPVDCRFHRRTHLLRRIEYK
jgi:hypothetical protein